MMKKDFGAGQLWEVYDLILKEFNFYSLILLQEFFV